MKSLSRKTGMAIVCLAAAGYSYAQVPPEHPPGEPPFHGDRPGGPDDRKKGERGDRKIFEKLRDGGRGDFEMRQRIGQLVRLPQDQLTAELNKWPRFQSMSLDERGKFLIRLQEIRQMQSEEAKRRAEDYGLTLTDAQLKTFEQKYWTTRWDKEKAISEKIAPLRKQMEQELRDEMIKEYGGKTSSNK